MQWQQWAAVAKEEYAMMALASASLKPRAYYYNIGISIGKDSKRGRVQCKGHTLAAMARIQGYCSGGGSGGSADTTIASTRQGQGYNGAGPAQVRQGQCNDGITTEVARERENG